VALEVEFRAWESRVVEVSRGHRLVLRCPVRDREVFDGPEERIRQALLHFFVHLGRTVEFLLGAERARHDVDLRWRTSRELSPTLPPLLIVETKVDGVAGDSTNDQLARYLAETSGECGVVFTGRRMWRLTIAADGARSVSPLQSLADLADLVRQRALLDPLAQARPDFRAASEGDIGALRRLVARYPFETFVLSIGGREVPCRQLKFSDESIQYRPAGQHTRHPTSVPRREVARLLRIEG
jgi:hypothetical protein